MKMDWLDDMTTKQIHLLIALNILSEQEVVAHYNNEWWDENSHHPQEEDCMSSTPLSANLNAIKRSISLVGKENAAKDLVMELAKGEFID